MNIAGLLKILNGVPSLEPDKFGPASDGRGPAFGLIPSARPPALAKLALANEGPTLLLTGRVDAVSIWQQALEAWLPEGQQVARFPEPTPLPYERGPWSRRSRDGRLKVLSRLVESQHASLGDRRESFVVVTSVRALLHKTLPKRRLVAATRILQPGQLLDLDKSVGDWLEAGYVPASVVESPGQFSRRGGIVDIFPVGARFPARIELFGDEIETLRIFHPATQRSSDVADNSLRYVVVPPARELLPGDVQELGRQLQESVPSGEGDIPDWRADLPDLASGRASPHLEYYLPMAYDQPGSLLEYLPDDTLIAIDDEPQFREVSCELAGLSAKYASEQNSLPPDMPSPLWPYEEILEQMAGRRMLILGEPGDGESNQAEYPARAFMPGPRYGGQVRPFILQLRQAEAAQERVVVVSQQAQRLSELWREDKGGDGKQADASLLPRESLSAIPAPGSVTFIQGSLSGGFTVEAPPDGSPDGQAWTSKALVHLLTDAEIFGWGRPAPRRRLKPRAVAPETYYADIRPNDFVVHLEFGIGRFLGLVVRAVGGTNREYLQLRYANDDTLYVPVHHADRLAKWIGPDDRLPELHRLGEKRWKKTKSRAQQAVDKLADELLDLYAVRETMPGHAFARDTHWQAELEASFPYQETEDQLRAIAEVKSDLEKPYPMDRLVCGDVGYGKTEVALRASFKAVMDGKQVAILVPTTVLAQQHFSTFRERLKPFPVNVEMLSRFRTQKQQENIIGRLRLGQIDVVIGTHRLLSGDVSFKDLGLLVIDEEQRFGVGHKERLKQMRTEVDVLTMTATPIPRTLYMGLTGVRDISLVDTAPADRLPVQNYVGEANDTMIRRAILRELDRGGQVFYVHNRVQTIRNAFVRLSNLVPEATFSIAHGQMSERELEAIMLRFVDADVDVLLTTTIIESGLDIPNANTLIVDRADQFGLAQLYQLRGRVGRGIRRAFAYFLHPPWHRLTSDAQARLDVIAAETELGAGYTIAMRDLEIRGAGDLLGARQSGHIAAVGFDLYTRLLAQAVKRRKESRSGQRVVVDLPESVLVDLPLAAYIPTDYVPDSALRLRLYRRMAVLGTLEEIDDMAAELADRFGAFPDPVDNLLYQLRIKVLATRAGVPSVTTESGQVQIRLPALDKMNRFHLQRYLGQDVRISRTAIWLGRQMQTRQWQIALVQILERLQTALGRGPESATTEV